MNSSAVEASNIEEVTHFQRQSSSTAKNLRGINSRLPNFHIDIKSGGKGDEKEILFESDAEGGNKKKKKLVSIFIPNNSSTSASTRSNGSGSELRNGKDINSTSADTMNNETGYYSDSSESDIEFTKSKSFPVRKKKRNFGSGSSNEGSTRSSSSSGNIQQFTKGSHEFSVSDENILHIPVLNTAKVYSADGIFAFIVFLTNLSEFIFDIALVCWHLADGLKWASALTGVFMMTGAIGLLHQFNLLQRSHLERLFVHGKRIRIVVNCFPPLAPIITSYQSAVIAKKSLKNPMLSNQFFEIEEFSKSLSKVQSFFQAAPQATLQLIILIDCIHEISLAKALFTVGSIIISLIVMINANLPSKSDYNDTENIHRAAYIPASRLFVGLRMLSSFGSRTMAITYLIRGFRCLFNDEDAVNAVVVSLFAMSIPRLIFTFADYAHRIVTSRQQNNPNANNFSRVDVSCIDTFLGYFATIFFPVGDPLWVFYYVWTETSLFVLFGNIIGWTTSCITTLVNTIYTGIFIVVFIVIPILLPYARATIKRQRMKKLDKIFDWKNNASTSEDTANNDSSSANNDDRISDEANADNILQIKSIP